MFYLFATNEPSVFRCTKKFSSISTSSFDLITPNSFPGGNESHWLTNAARILLLRRLNYNLWENVFWKFGFSGKVYYIWDVWRYCSPHDFVSLNSNDSPKIMKISNFMPTGNDWNSLNRRDYSFLVPNVCI